MTDISKTQCWRIQELLKKGEAWTRQAWIDHPIFKDRFPRIILLRELSNDLGPTRLRGHPSQGDDVVPYQDHYRQITYGGPGEPHLRTYPYRPGDEDWEATDWLQVDKEGYRTGFFLLDDPNITEPVCLCSYIGCLSQDIEECSYAEDSIRFIWNNGTLDEEIDRRLKKYPHLLKNWRCKDGKYSDLLTHMVHRHGGWDERCDYSVSKLTKQEKEIVDAYLRRTT